MTIRTQNKKIANCDMPLSGVIKEPKRNAETPDDSPMTAAGVLEWLAAADSEILYTVFSYDNIPDLLADINAEQIVKDIAAYEAEKKKQKLKPVEFEWADVCRITRIPRDGGWHECVHEEELMDGKKAEDILQKYVAKRKQYDVDKGLAPEHNDYFATVERRCRIKEQDFGAIMQDEK